MREPVFAAKDAVISLLRKPHLRSASRQTPRPLRCVAMRKSSHVCSHNDQLTKGIPRAALVVVAIHSKISISIRSYPCGKRDEPTARLRSVNAPPREQSWRE